jgi:general stress protein 26
MAAYNPRIAIAKKSWENDGHKDELYQMPAPRTPADFQQPKLFEGKVVFVMGKRTFSSAGMLFTLARDNHIGTIIGTTSTFSPSHYGEVLPYRLPNTSVLGSISCKFFARPNAAMVDDKCMTPDVKVNLDDKDAAWKYIIDNYGRINENSMKQKFCQSCGMPLTEDVLGTNADGTKNEDYCMYCYKDGRFLQDCTMEEMIEHCAQFVGAVNEGLEKPITKEEYIGMMKTYFPQLKRWRQTLDVNNDEAMNTNPALAGVKELIAQMTDKQPIAYISSVDQEGFPWTKAMLKPRKREGIKTFYFTTNTFSIRVAHYKANPKASIYFCDTKGFKGMMLRGTMEVLTDAASKEMIWRDGDEQYYPGGVTDPNYCVLKFTATDGRFYSDFYPRSFVIE